jgi:hypothetical protein
MGMTRLNGYLHQIRAAETDQCECGQAKRNGQALSLPMHEMGGIPNKYWHRQIQEEEISPST